MRYPQTFFRNDWFSSIAFTLVILFLLNALPSLAQDNYLPPAALQYIDQLPQPTVDFSKVILPNGKTIRAMLDNNRVIAAADTPKEILSKLLAGFAKTAENLVDDTQHQYPTPPQISADKYPPQDGIYYSYGGRNHKVREEMNREGTKCDLFVHALDCSGFIYQLFEKEGCTGMNLKAVQQASVTTLDFALSNITDKLHAVDKKKLATADFLPGDIIYWSKMNGVTGSHIGIAFNETNGNRILLYQSSGDNDCKLNVGKGRGPRTYPLTTNYFFGPNSEWKVFRIETK